MAEEKTPNLSFTSPLADDLHIHKLFGEERISGLFRFDLALISEKNDLDFSKIVGKDVSVSMDHGDGKKRVFHGMAARFVQSGVDQRFTTYYAEIYPWLWKLTLTQNSQIFQNKTVPVIIKEVFEQHAPAAIKDSLTGTYQPREYCVQHQESAFNFVSRLMEEEGIYYYFEHATAAHTLVLIDDLGTHVPVPDLVKARMKQSGSKIQTQDIVVGVTREERLTTGKYAVDDFNFETPTADLMVAAAGANDHRIYEYAPGFGETGDGEKIAARRLEAYELPAKLIRGESYCRAFIAGYKFTLAEHGRADINGDYILHQVNHYATQEDYSNRFVAFPADAPYRPPLVARKPKVVGNQSALVVGPSGEEIHSDEYGRIKVQFHWDQVGANDENSSCWIRVAQGWAGKAWGSIFIPRIGQEVLVSYLNGDPDRPIVTGCVYNAEQTVPYALPDNQTKSAIKTRSSAKGKPENFNEIRFEDKKGSEEIYIHAEKDMNIMVENNRTLTIGDEKTADDGSDTILIKKDRTTTLKEGDETLTVTKGKRTTTIKKDETLTVQEGNRKITVTKGNNTTEISKGTDTYHVVGDRTVNLDKNETRTIKKNFTQNVTKNYTLTVKGDLLIDVTGKVTIKSGKDMLLDSSGKLDAKAAMDLTTKGQNITNDAGMNLTNKAGIKLVNKAVSMVNDASAKLENKAGGMHDVTAGGILKLQGSLLKLN